MIRAAPADGGKGRRCIMRNNYISIFDVIGPVMVGPSSSHTSGAASIAWMARQIFTGTPVRAVFTLYGSFADTYKGHGTDRALVGGMLGYRPDDTHVPGFAGMVIDRAHPLNLESLHSQNIQSLIVEGGAQTLRSFLVQNLWDEIRVETNTTMTVSGGTRAPQIPANAAVIESKSYGDNQIILYRKA